jgi:hypothetical protein
MTWRSWRFPPCDGEAEPVEDAVVPGDTDGRFEEPSVSVHADARTHMINGHNKR